MKHDFYTLKQVPKINYTTVIAAITTFVVIPSGIYGCQSRTVQAEKNQTTNTQNLVSQPQQPEISRKPKQGWEQYFPSQTKTTLTGRLVNELKTLLGEPPVLVRSIAANPEYSREVWVYFPYEDDPTGLYIYFKGGRVTKTKLDEFNGLVGSAIFEDRDFWLN